MVSVPEFCFMLKRRHCFSSVSCLVPGVCLTVPSAAATPGSAWRRHDVLGATTLGTVTTETVRRVSRAQRSQRGNSCALARPLVSDVLARRGAIVTHRLVGVPPPAPSAVWSTGDGQRVKCLTIFCSTMTHHPGDFAEGAPSPAIARIGPRLQTFPAVLFIAGTQTGPRSQLLG
jgi:hypothetical protein